MPRAKPIPLHQLPSHLKSLEDGRWNKKFIEDYLEPWEKHMILKECYRAHLLKYENVLGWGPITIDGRYRLRIVVDSRDRRLSFMTNVDIANVADLSYVKRQPDWKLK